MNISPLSLIKFFKVFLVGASVGILAWTITLPFYLPDSYNVRNWNYAWIGFDVGMWLSVLVTTWAIWKMRQIVIPFSFISATFFIIDAWFDIMTSAGGGDFWQALCLGIFLELPCAAFLFWFGWGLTYHTLIPHQDKNGEPSKRIRAHKLTLTILPTGNKA